MSVGTAATRAANSSIDSARSVVARLAGEAGVKLVGPDAIEQLHTVANLWRDIWDRQGEPPVSAELLRALVHSGNYLGAAHRDGEIVGALLGFFGGDDEGPDHLHSHILGVAPGARVAGVGFALKQHQRLWALERGIDRITWTYDPLVAANGWFNLGKLGAEGVDYLVNFYGPMPDSINGGDESDRVLVRWDLASQKAQQAASGKTGAIDLDEARAQGAEVALEIDPDGRPALRDTGAEVRLCQVPRDIVAVRVTSPEVAREWRFAMRDAVTSAAARGLHISGVARGGWYILSR